MKNIILLIILFANISLFAQKPANDFCNNAQSLNYITTSGAFTKGTLLGATADTVGTIGAENVWYKFNLNGTKQNTAILLNELKNTKNLFSYEARLYTGTCKNLKPVGASNGLSCFEYYPDSIPNGAPIFIEFFGDSQANFNIGIAKKHALAINQSCDKALTINVSSTCQPTFADLRLADNLEYNSGKRQFFKFIGTGKNVLLEMDNFKDGSLQTGLFFVNVFAVNCNNNASFTKTYYNNDLAKKSAIFYTTLGVEYIIELGSSSCFSGLNFNICLQNAPNPPLNDKVENAVELSVSPTLKPIQRVKGTTKYATTFNPLFNSKCLNNASQEVWYKFVATQEAQVLRIYNIKSILPNDNKADFAATIFNDSLGYRYCLAPNPNDSVRFINKLTVGKTYYIAVEYYNFNATNIDAGYDFELSLCTPPTPPNDLRENAQQVSVGKDWDCTNTVAGTTRWSGTDGAFYPYNSDVWYKFVATSTAHEVKLENVVFIVKGANEEPKVQIFDSLLTKQLYYNQISSKLVVGKTYYVQVATKELENQIYFNLCVTTPINNTPNRTCANAIALTVNSGMIPDIQTNGLTPILYEEPSNDCYSNNSIWYKFTATQKRHAVNMQNADNTKSFVTYYNVLKGNCGTFEPCSSSSMIETEIGETYYITVSSKERERFKLAILSPTLSQNTSCDKSLTINANQTNNAAFIYSIPMTNELEGTKFWYNFVATSKRQRFNLSSNAVVQSIPTFNIYEADDCANLKLFLSNGTTAYMDGFQVGKKYYVEFIKGSNNDALYAISILPYVYNTAYEDCENALEITPSAIGNCNFTSVFLPAVTIIKSSNSVNYECPFGGAGEIFLKFTATKTRHLIELQNQNQFQITLLDNCAQTKPLSCDVTSLLDSLTVGKTYILRIVNQNTVPNNFKICITTLGDAPSNDEYQNATLLVVNPLTAPCANKKEADFKGATPSNVTTDCQSAIPNDIWYQFTPTSSRINVVLAKALPSTFYSVLSKKNGNDFEAVVCNARDTSFNNLTINDLDINKKYYLQIRNENNTLSNKFNICINAAYAPPVPVNDSCKNAITIVPQNSGEDCILQQYTTFGATKETDKNQCTGATDKDVWFKFVPTQDQYFIRTEANMRYALYNGNCDNLDLKGCNNVDNIGSGILQNLALGVTYYVRISTSGEQDFKLCISKYTVTPLPNDNCTGAILLENNAGLQATKSKSAFTTFATPSNLPSSTAECPLNGDPNDVWYRFVATDTSHIVSIFDINGEYNFVEKTINGFVYKGNCATISQPFACFKNTNVLHKLTIGATYTIRLWGEQSNYKYSYKIAILTNKSQAYNCSKAINIPITSKNNLQYVSIETTNIAQDSISKTNNCDFDVIDGKHIAWAKFSANNSYAAVIRFKKRTEFSSNDLLVKIFQGSCKKLISKYCISPDLPHLLDDLEKDSTYFILFQEKKPNHISNFEVSLENFEVQTCQQAKQLSINPDMNATIQYADSMNFELFPQDIKWYKFVATNKNLRIVYSKMIPKKQVGAALRMDFYYSCDSLSQPVELERIYANDSSVWLKNLQVGKTYLIRPFSEFAAQKYTIALLTPTVFSPNIDCQNAISINASDNEICQNPTKVIFNNVSRIEEQLCGNVFPMLLSYRFTAKSITHIVDLSNIKGNFNLNFDAISAYITYSDSCGKPQAVVCKSVFISQNGTAQFIFGDLIPNANYTLFIGGNVQPDGFSFDMCIKSFPKPLVNDECAGAKLVEVNPSMIPTKKYQENLFGATASTNLDSTNVRQDVWYKFTATNTIAILSLKGNCSYNNRFFVQLAEGNCTNLQAKLTCNAAYEVNSSIYLNQLTIGKSYYFTLSAENIEDCEIEFSLLNPSLSVPNDEITNAVSLPINPSDAVTQTTTGTTVGSTKSIRINDYCNYATGDVWYTFTATSQTHKVVLFPQKVNTLFLFVLNEKGETVYFSNEFQDTSNINRLLRFFTIGQKYYILVSNIQPGLDANIGSAFKLAITTPSLPVNYTCNTAVTLEINPTQVINKYYSQNNRNNFFQDTILDDVSRPIERSFNWYKFTATSQAHSLRVYNQKGNAATSKSFKYIIVKDCNADVNQPLLEETYPYPTNDSLWRKLEIGKTYYLAIVREKFYYSNINNFNITYDIAIVNNNDLPSNDEPSNAITIPVNAKPFCNVKSSGSTLYATLSLINANKICNTNADIWYKFTATSDYHFIDISNTKALQGDVVNMEYEIFRLENGTYLYYGCSTDLDRGKYDPWQMQVGTTYYVRVTTQYNSLFSKCSFDICVSTLIPQDNYQGAIPVVAAKVGTLSGSGQGQKEAACTFPVVGNSEGATYSNEVGVPQGTCNQSNLPRDIWFKNVVEEGKENIAFTFLKTPQGADAQALAYHRVNGKLVLFNTVNCPVDTLRNLTKGDTIYFRVWDSFDKYFGDYEVCIKAFAKKTIATKDVICGNVTIYPVPTNDILNVNVSFITASRFDINVFNVSGQLVLQKNYDTVTQNALVQLNTATLPLGIYILQIKEGAQIYNRKFVKK